MDGQIKKGEKQQILVCPHCGNKAPQEIKCTAYGNEKIEVGPKNDHGWDVKTYTFFVQCQTCLEAAVYWDWDESNELGNLEEATILFPSTKKFSGIPKAIQDSYDEAKKVQKLSPTAFAVLIRKALEYLCREQSASGNTLKEQLDDLAKKNIIPATLSRMANALRYFGNIGAHSIEIKIGPEEAQAMDDFFIAVVEYVYVAPEKLKKLSEGLKLKNSFN